MKNYYILILLFCSLAFYNPVFSCSPCGALSNITSTVNGTNLEISLTSNTGWDCCYTAQIELICDNQSFTGNPNYFSSEICYNGGGGSGNNTLSITYPLIIIDISNFCTGSYKWRASEMICDIYTAEFQFNYTSSFGSLIALTSSISNDSICKFESTQLNSSASGGCNVNPNYTYSWSPSTGLNNASSPNPTATPLSTTNYTLTVSENGSCATPQTANFTVFVNNTPSATISGATSVCEANGTSNITITPSGLSPPFLINYNLNGVLQAPQTTSSAFIIPVPLDIPGDYIYSIVSIVESNILQCQSTSNSSAQITVKPIPIVNLGPDITCFYNSNAILDANNAGATFLWNNNTTAQTLNVNTTGTYSVLVTLNQCSSSDTIDIKEDNLPHDIILSNSTGCQPVSISFDAPVGINSDPITSQIWNFGDNVTINSQNTNHVYNNVGTYNGTYTVTSIFGCQFDTTFTIQVFPYPIVNLGSDINCFYDSSAVLDANNLGASYLWNDNSTGQTLFINSVGEYYVEVTKNQCSTSDTLSVIGTNLPNKIVLSDTAGCNPLDVSFDVLTDISNSPILTWSWNFGEPTSSNSQNTTHLYTIAGTYNGVFSVTSTLGCQFDTTFTIVVHPTPISEFVFQNSNIEEVIFINNSTNYIESDWTFGDGAVSSDENPIHIYDESGNFAIKLISTNEFECKDTVIHFIEFKDFITCYAPNTFTPNGDEHNNSWKIYASGIDLFNFECFIYNKWGELIWESRDISIPWDGTYTDKIVEEGTYTWTVKIKEKGTSEEKSFKGFLNVIR